ncbi:MAG: Sua5/YciO/YrdC/YwlC family protein, partial [Candidatus Nanopelagicales bacterium]
MAALLTTYVDDAVRALRAGGLVAVPTETVYGLAADADNPGAVARIYSVKRRPPDHPVIVHLAHADAVADWARSIPGWAR